MVAKSATETKPRKLPKPRSQDHRAYWREHWDDDHACDTPQGHANFRFALAARDVDFYNLIPVSGLAPEFHLASETETAADRKRFAEFLDRHFPRSDDKFAELRRFLGFGRRAWRLLPHSPDRALTLIEVYGFLAKERNFLRAMSIHGDYIAKMTGETRPPLRICDCGLLFLASRPNVKWHSKACGSRVRMAKARADGKTEDYEAKSEGKKADKERKQKLKAKGASR